MALGRFLEYLVENRRTLAWIMYGVLALLVILDLLIPSGYDRFWWESVGGFGAFYGFISCTLIIVVSKALGKVLLNRPEDYYDD
jgi:uncharacterized membrane protein